MGNDLFNTFIMRKKASIADVAELFFVYAVGEKANLHKILNDIVKVYIEDLYYGDGNLSDEIKEYYAIDMSQDILFKNVLLATIRYYKKNDMADRIEEDKSLMILLANSVFLALLLEEVAMKKTDGNLEKDLALFLKSYSQKIRIQEGQNKELLQTALLDLLKKEKNAITKVLKIFENAQYKQNIQSVTTYPNGYTASLSYEIKPLVKYTQKEIEQASNSISLDHAIMNLELTVFQMVKDYLAGNKERIYFIDVPIACFEKVKYRQAIDTIMTNEVLKSHIVFMFHYGEIKEHRKLVASITTDGYHVAAKAIDMVKITENSFKNIQYVFVTSQFLEDHLAYKDAWQDIQFIIK